MDSNDNKIPFQEQFQSDLYLLPLDLLYNIIKKIKFSNDIYNFCLINKYFNEIINKNNEFWRIKYRYDYGFDDLDDEIISNPQDWKKIYKEIGNIYISGTEKYLNLGIQNETTLSNFSYNNKYSLTQISKLKAKFVTTGIYSSFIIDIQNDVLSFGENDLGQLGLGDKKNRHIPKKIQNFKAKSISSGFGHTLFIDMNDNLLACGVNYWGQIGMGDGRYDKFLKPTVIPKIPILFHDALQWRFAPLGLPSCG